MCLISASEKPRNLSRVSFISWNRYEVEEINKKCKNPPQQNNNESPNLSIKPDLTKCIDPSSAKNGLFWEEEVITDVADAFDGTLLVITGEFPSQKVSNVELWCLICH